MKSTVRSTNCPPPGERKMPGFTRLSALIALAMLAQLLLVACDQLPGVAPKAEVPVGTSVAETIQAALQPAGVPIGTSIAQTVAAAMPTALPTTVEPVLPTEAATYTPYPTFTPMPTYTEQPTYTPLPTYTSYPTEEEVYYPPISYYTEPTAVTSYSNHPYVLRVWNRNVRQTLWIGTEMPYGGNFIKPMYYVEFYPPTATWMHIVYCRREVEVTWPGWWENKWYKNWSEDWYDNYKKNYICSAKNVFVDQSFEEISVK